MSRISVNTNIVHGLVLGLYECSLSLEVLHT